MEKLLLVGGDIATPDAINYCKEIGVYTIMTNDLPYANNPFKQMADEAWEIPVEELDVLEAKCREVGVTGVFAGVNEHNLDMAKALAERLGLPFYASDEAWACARNKGLFKEHCIAVGLDVPKRYSVTPPITAEMIADITFPVIVKPADSCGQQGLSVCYKEADLSVAYEKALHFSTTKSVIVEDYIEGDEITFPFLVMNGKPIINNTFLQLPLNVNGRPTFSLIIDNISHWKRFEQKHSSHIHALMERLGCNNGIGVLQTIYKDGKYYFLEFGYRLDGMGGWRLDKKRTGFDACAYLVDTNLGHTLNHWSSTVGNQNPPLLCATYLLYSNPGKVTKSVGLDEVKNRALINVSYARFQEGSEVLPTGNMMQTAYTIIFLGKDLNHLGNQLRFINETLHLYDENGNDMLIYFDDYSIFEENPA